MSNLLIASAARRHKQTCIGIRQEHIHRGGHQANPSETAGSEKGRHQPVPPPIIAHHGHQIETTILIT